MFLPARVDGRASPAGLFPRFPVAWPLEARDAPWRRFPRRLDKRDLPSLRAILEAFPALLARVRPAAPRPAPGAPRARDELHVPLPVDNKEGNAHNDPEELNACTEGNG